MWRPTWWTSHEWSVVGSNPKQARDWGSTLIPALEVLEAWLLPLLLVCAVNNWLIHWCIAERELPSREPTKWLTEFCLWLATVASRTQQIFLSSSSIFVFVVVIFSWVPTATIKKSVTWSLKFILMQLAKTYSLNSVSVWDFFILISSYPDTVFVRKTVQLTSFGKYACINCVIPK